MDTMALAIAGVAALAIVLIAVGVATSGGSGISDRLERYAAKPTAAAKAGATGKGGVAELIATEPGPQQPQPGRRAARLRGEPRPRHRARRPQAQAVRVPGDLGRRRSSASRSLMFLLSAFLPALGNPLFLLIGAPGRLPAAALLAGSAPQRAGSVRSTSSCRTRSRSSPTPCAPVRRSCRPSNSSCASPARRSRPSSAGSSARSTSASRSTRPSRTWSAASARTTSS